MTTVNQGQNTIFQPKPYDPGGHSDSCYSHYDSCYHHSNHNNSCYWHSDSCYTYLDSCYSHSDACYVHNNTTPPPPTYGSASLAGRVGFTSANLECKNENGTITTSGKLGKRDVNITEVRNSNGAAITGKISDSSSGKEDSVSLKAQFEETSYPSYKVYNKHVDGKVGDKKVKITETYKSNNSKERTITGSIENWSIDLKVLENGNTVTISGKINNYYDVNLVENKKDSIDIDLSILPLLAYPF